jgi:hypothetical protein
MRFNLQRVTLAESDRVQPDNSGVGVREFAAQMDGGGVNRGSPTRRLGTSISRANADL